MDSNLLMHSRNGFIECSLIAMEIAEIRSFVLSISVIFGE